MNALLFATILVASASVSDCTEADPCPLRVTLDDSGIWFDTPGDHDATLQQHRWYTLDVLNQFDEDHELRLDGQNYIAPGYDADDGPRSRHGPLHFPKATNLTLRDQTTAAQATLHIEAAEPLPEAEVEDPAQEPEAPAQDPATDEQDPGPSGPKRKEVPAASPILTVLALGLLLAYRRD